MDAIRVCISLAAGHVPGITESKTSIEFRCERPVFFCQAHDIQDSISKGIDALESIRIETVTGTCLADITGAGVFADWIDAFTMSQALDAAWDDFRAGTASRPEGRIEVYARRLLTQRMADLFNSLL